MNISDKTPTFNLKVVIQDTGLKPHTLRAWERRYGLPQPRRSTSGHRLYSQYDINVVKWLIARQDEGLTISRAVELWTTLQEKAEDPFSVTSFQQSEDLSVSMFFAKAKDGESTLTGIRNQWIECCLRYDETGAEAITAHAFALFPMKMVIVEVFQKGLMELGNRWYANKATAQQEHFASSLTLKRLGALLSGMPNPTRLGRILAACPPQEEHTVALLMLTLFLRYAGWDVVYLGANVPIGRLELAIDSIKPDLVVLGAQRLHTAALLAQIAWLLNDKKTSVAYGGLIFNLIPELRKRIPGHFLGEELEQAVAHVGQIMAFNPAKPEVEHRSCVYEASARYYREKRAMIELDALQASGAYEVMPFEYVDTTNIRLSDSIMAALYLGEMDFIDAEIDLQRQLILNYGISSNWQSHYFDAYCTAARKHLNEGALPVVEWLDRLRASYSVG